MVRIENFYSIVTKHTYVYMYRWELKKDKFCLENEQLQFRKPIEMMVPFRPLFLDFKILLFSVQNVLFCWLLLHPNIGSKPLKAKVLKKKKYNMNENTNDNFIFSISIFYMFYFILFIQVHCLVAFWVDFFYSMADVNY